MLIARHHANLPDGADAPEWVHLVPAGTFRGVDGRGPYRLADPQAVIAASMKAGRLPIDENHATDHAMATGIASPARGWIVEMAARDDGLWGRVEWTPSGAALMAERAYRGISPVFTHAKDGTVLTVLRAALTNTPNLTQLASLQSETSMDLALLRQALGLPETADEAAILAAAAGVATARQAQQAAAGEAAQLAATVVSLQTQLATLAADAARTRAVAFVDGAIRAGKPINPLRDHFIARHMADAAAVETEINALPSINAGGVALHASAGAGPDDEMPTAEEMSVAKKMGLDPKKMAAQRRRRMAGDDGEKS